MSDPINSILNWLENLFASWGLAPGLVSFLVILLTVVAIAGLLLLLDIFLVWVERKVVARFQDRYGPNRLGPFGLIQPIADVIKLLIKEDTTPANADKVLYNIAPIIALAIVFVLWAVIPFTPTFVGSDLNVGVLYVVAVGAISTLGIIMAGWASNNKYALLGAFRMVAMIVSYEVPMVVIMLIPVIFAGSMSIQDIVKGQSVWYIILAPVATLILFVTSLAELGRSPFDLIEAESEIVAGYHIEYSGMKFGLFYAGELLHALTISALISSFFLGGWRGPFVEQVPILGVFYLFIKAFFVYWVIMWVKYTVPRVRIDHVLALSWKFLTPLALIMVILTAIFQKIFFNASVGVYTAVMVLLNVVVIWVTLIILKRYAQIRQTKVAEPRPFARPSLLNTTESMETTKTI